MPLVRVNIGHALPPRLLRLAAALPPAAPIVVMVHGYRYSPSDPRRDPHRHILSPHFGPGDAVMSWPRGLGISLQPKQAGGLDEGLAVALGWEAGGWLRKAYEQAGQTGAALSRIVAALAQAGGRPVAVIGHSLGGRVALSCLATAERDSLSRLVLLNAAEFRDAAERALASPAGRRAEVLNVISRENDLFDVALERLIAGGRRRAIGLGLPQSRPNWIDLQIDQERSLRALAGLGYPVAARRRLLSHWSPCQTPGLFELYRTVLCTPRALPWSVLRQHLPGRPEPRWSRLTAWGQDAASAIAPPAEARTA